MYNENITTEFKREYTSEIKKEIVAFANTEGGSIYIGIDDDGNIIGVNDEADKIMLQITSMLRDAIKPDITLFTSCSVVEIEGKKIVKLDVQRGVDRPYYIGDKGLKPSGVYMRQGSSSFPVSNDAIRQMIKETDGDKFENVRSLNQELSFDSAALEFKKRNLEFEKTHMKTLGLIGRDGLYTNLGLLLADQCVHTTKVAVFQGLDKTEFKDRRDFSGSLLKQLNDVYEFIDLNNKTKATFSGLNRLDTRDYSETAIREVLLNAIVHRDYSFSGSILISLFDDRLEVVSLGGLVSGLSVDDIMIGASQARNEKLANIFYRLRLIEAYGTGITKIISSYADFHKKPEFIATDSAFLVKIFNRNYGENTEVLLESDKNLKAILEYISENGSITRKDVEALMGVKQTMAGKILKKYEQSGYITPIGSGKTIGYITK